ncbi:sulfatase-like hydrolase/transferase [Phytohabitans rumicis]|uniref:sulfatase-like hydrolase/transferase n=1 Tax=Phytohabitans rumicis TaxID=1076125 RepID=UPI0035305AEA
MAYTDRLLGETIAAMEASKLYEDALFVVTADHGVSFTPDAQGRGMGAVQKAGDEVLWVPLFIKEPRQAAGRVDDRNWEHVDLLPTVADLAGVTVPWKTDGISAVRETRERVDKRYHDVPSKPVTVPGPANFAEVLRGSAGRPAALAQPRADLIGTPAAALPAAGSRTASATVSNADDFRAVDLASGTIPALVYGTVPSSVPAGTLLAVAVNGRIAAVTQVAKPDKEGHRFGALITDESVFRTGENQVDVIRLE